MITRKLGRTGLKVSQLGFGAMRLPMMGEGDKQRVNRELAIPMIHRAFEGGRELHRHRRGLLQRGQPAASSARRSGLARRPHRRLHQEPLLRRTTRRSGGRNLENSLERLGTVSYIDIYNHHGIGWKRYTDYVEPRLSKWMQKAKDQGLIRHICCSFHDNNEALRKLVDTGYADVITLQYNMLDRQLEEGIAYAHEKGIGVVVMGPVGGGRLGSDSEVLAQLTPQHRARAGAGPALRAVQPERHAWRSRA